MTRHNEKPSKRINPSGKIVWVARYTNRAGKRLSAGTFELRGPCRKETVAGDCCAQHAIRAAYEREQTVRGKRQTVGEYAADWTNRYPRAERTNKSYNGRLKQVLPVPLDGLPLRDWPMADLRRSQVVDLLNTLLVEQKRSAVGAQGMLRILSAMWEDALGEDRVPLNPFMRVRVRASDPRVTKPPRKIQVYTQQEMRAFANLSAWAAEHRGHEVNAWRAMYGRAMVRVFSDCGMRLGEVLALRRPDLKLGRCDEPGCNVTMAHFHVRHTAHDGVIQAGTKVDHGESNAGRVVPIPADLEAVLRSLPARLDTTLVFPSPRGKVWQEGNWYRDVWYPTRRLARIDPTPHEFRHSWISNLRAAGIDPADLAAAAGHTVATATARYVHALYQSFDAMSEAVDADAYPTRL